MTSAMSWMTNQLATKPTAKRPGNHANNHKRRDNACKKIREYIGNRKCTVGDVADDLNMPVTTAGTYLRFMFNEGDLDRAEHGFGFIYFIPKNKQVTVE